MKRILIIMGNHSPAPSSVSNCAAPIISKLSERFDIDIITDRKSIQFEEYESKEKINIYRIDDYRYMNTEAMNAAKSIKSKGLTHAFALLLTALLKLIYYLRYCIFTLEKGTGGWDAGMSVKKCIELHEKKNYSAVISFSLPYKCHYIAEKFIKTQNDKIRWFVFQFDPFSYNDEIKMNFILRNKLKHDEMRIFNKCDKIFLTPELFKFYQNTPFNCFFDKTISVPFVNIKPIEYDTKSIKETKLDQSKFNCIFIGRLYKKIRNPGFALRVFLQMKNDIVFTLVTNYTPEETGIAGIKTNLRIVFYPLQRRAVALDMLMKSDILVNIGNTVEFQVPGKIFEYMSTGKPIIHFSKSINDPSLRYFEKYPWVFILNEWEPITPELIDNLSVFCHENRGRKMEFDTVSKLLAEFDSEDVVTKFADTLEDIIGNE